MEKLKSINFITTNKQKVFEFRQALPEISFTQLDIDLEEIQSLSSRKIIEHKLQSAFKHHSGPFVIEDTSLYLECMNWQLPGPFIKFFNEAVGQKQMADLIVKSGKINARAEVSIALAKSPRQVKFWVGKTQGRITKPKGKYKFGFDEILIPDGCQLTLSQMKAQGDFSHSPRAKVIKQLKTFILK